MTEVRTNEHTNGRTDKRKDENYVPLGINAGGIKSSVMCQESWINESFSLRTEVTWTDHKSPFWKKIFYGQTRQTNFGYNAVTQHVGSLNKIAHGNDIISDF